MVLHSDNCCYTYIRPILHAMGQDDMITYIQVHTLPVDIRYHDMVLHHTIWCYTIGVTPVWLP